MNRVGSIWHWLIVCGGTYYATHVSIPYQEHLYTGDPLILWPCVAVYAYLRLGIARVGLDLDQPIYNMPLYCRPSYPNRMRRIALTVLTWPLIVWKIDLPDMRRAGQCAWTSTSERKAVALMKAAGVRPCAEAYSVLTASIAANDPTMWNNYVWYETKMRPMMEAANRQ